MPEALDPKNDPRRLFAAATTAAAAAPYAPILVDDAQGAVLYGVGLRTFLELQRQPWFPKPIVLGPRIKRHSTVLLMEAVANMPRQSAEPSEPRQLLRGKIEKLKRAGVATA